MWYCLLYAVKVILPFESVHEILKCDHSNESVTEQCFPVVLFIMLHKGGSNFWVCGWNPKVWPFKWNHWAVLSCGAVYYVVQGGSNFWVCECNNLKCDHSNESYSIEQYFPVLLFIILYKVDLNFVSLNEILKRDHSNESYVYIQGANPRCLHSTVHIWPTLFKIPVVWCVQD